MHKRTFWKRIFEKKHSFVFTCANRLQWGTKKRNKGENANSPDIRNIA